jgi:hypothetical protein
MNGGEAVRSCPLAAGSGPRKAAASSRFREPVNRFGNTLKKIVRKLFSKLLSKG